jgi:DNA-binding NtrC family response regulator
VDDIPLSVQVKLLRVLQEREFERVGANVPTPVDVRVICATKVDLWNMVQAGTFREDLYYRIKVIPVKLAPLRERREDIPVLVEHFLSKSQKPNLRFSPEALELMIQASWPGNVRQLENIVQRIAALAPGDVVEKDMIPAELHLGARKHDLWDFNARKSLALEAMLEEFEHSALRWALEKSKGNQSEAARLLNLSRTTLRDKLRKHKLH